MTEQRNAPTCASGWEPLHEGCPVCGPDGPCHDPEYEGLIQANLRRKRDIDFVTMVLAVAIGLVLPFVLMGAFQ